MKNKYTKINWNPDRGKSKSVKPKAVVRKKGGDVTTNYSLMLQLYLIKKEEAANKGVAKFKQPQPEKPGFITRTSALIMGIAPLFMRLFDMFHRESKASVTMITE